MKGANFLETREDLAEEITKAIVLGLGFPPIEIVFFVGVIMDFSVDKDRDEHQGGNKWVVESGNGEDYENLGDSRKIFGEFIVHASNGGSVGVDRIHEATATDFFQEIFVDGREFVENALIKTIINFADTIAKGATV